MQNYLKMRILLFLCLIIVLTNCNTDSKKTNSDQLFVSDSLPAFTMSAPFSTVFSDCDEKRFYHSATLHYLSENKIVELPIRIKTRGYFRRDSNICELMPLKLKFKKKEVKNTLFEGQNTLKLVLPCSADAAGGQLLLREYLAYKIYSVLTPYSFKVQLIDLSLQYSNSNQWKTNLPAFFIEPENNMGKRNSGKVQNTPYLSPTETNQYLFNLMAVFQYLIGNDDWSLYNLHNIKLVYLPSNPSPVPVPYDFDMSAFVNAPYSFENNVNNTKPDSIEQINTLNELKAAISEAELAYIFGIIIQKKDTIYSIVNNCTQLSEMSKNECNEQLNQVYKSIEEH